MIRPSASTASTPSTCDAHRAPPHDLEAAGVGGHHAADGGGVASAEVDAECPARRAGRGVEGGQRDAGCRRDLARGIGRPDRVASSRRSDSTTSPPAGTPPPTRPVLPPWGTTATSCSLHHARTAATSSVEPGRTTAAARPTNRPVQSRS